MSDIQPSTARALQQGFKQFNRLMIGMWRLGLGREINLWPQGFGRILVINHTGRKTGLRRRTPVNYAMVDGDIYVTAGFGSGSDWYRNLIAHPEIEVWLPDGWWAARAEELEDPENRLFLLRRVLIASGFAAFAAGINPYRISDEDLHRLTSSYRLLRIRRSQARTGPGGPGELAWVWPLATMILLPLLFLRRRPKKRRKDG
jgi:deazaflavin-dependent oxidoreductase (nitroreductase family)